MPEPSGEPPIPQRHGTITCGLCSSEWTVKESPYQMEATGTCYWELVKHKYPIQKVCRVWNALSFYGPNTKLAP